MLGNKDVFPKERCVSKQWKLSPSAAEDGYCFRSCQQLPSSLLLAGGNLTCAMPLTLLLFQLMFCAESNLGVFACYLPVNIPA